jgi:hypothetical protein
MFYDSNAGLSRQQLLRVAGLSDQLAMPLHATVK